MVLQELLKLTEQPTRDVPAKGCPPLKGDVSQIFKLTVALLRQSPPVEDLAGKDDEKGLS